MDCISFIPNHLIHPFSVTQGGHKAIPLTTFEKVAAIVSSVAVFIFGGVSPLSALGSLIVVYGLTAFFKYRNFEIDPPLEIANKTQAIANSNSSPFGTFGKDYDDVLPVAPTAVSYPVPSNNSSTQKSYHSSKFINDQPETNQDVNFLNSILQNNYSLRKNRELVQNKLDSMPTFFSSFFPQNNFISSFSNFYENSPKKVQLKLLQLLPTNMQNHFFKPMLKKYFDIKKIPGDGDCCVYALILGQTPNLNSTELKKSAMDTRLRVVRHMKQNRTLYEGFCDAVLEKHTPLELLLNAYQEKISKKKIGFKLSLTQFIVQEIDKQTDELSHSKTLSQYNFELDRFNATLNKNELAPEEYNQRFQQFLTSKFKRNADGDIAVNFEEYLDVMLERGTHFGTQEIKAFAESSHVPVIVYNPNNVYIDDENDLHPMESCVYGGEFLNSTKPIYLYHKNGNHYDLMIPRENKTIPRPKNPPKTYG